MIQVHGPESDYFVGLYLLMWHSGEENPNFQDSEEVLVLGFYFPIKCQLRL